MNRRRPQESNPGLLRAKQVRYPLHHCLSGDLVQITFKKSERIVVELIGNRPVQYSSTCQSGTQNIVLSIWGRGPCLVSQVPCIGDALVVVGVKKINALGEIRIHDLPTASILIATAHHCPRYQMKKGPSQN